jgi:hypothetical protein
MTNAMAYRRKTTIPIPPELHKLYAEGGAKGGAKNSIEHMRKAVNARWAKTPRRNPGQIVARMARQRRLKAEREHAERKARERQAPPSRASEPAPTMLDNNQPTNK